MKKMLVLLFVFMLMSCSATAFDLEMNNISETDGFYIEYVNSQINIKNKTGDDAFNVYVLFYRQDDPTFTMNVENNKQYGSFFIPVMPDGFTYNLKNVSLDNTSVAEPVKQIV